jgi:hypothetical protein
MHNDIHVVYHHPLSFPLSLHPEGEFLKIHFIARNAYGLFSQVIVWLIWSPVWVAVVTDAFLGRRAG